MDLIKVHLMVLYSWENARLYLCSGLSEDGHGNFGGE